MLRSRGKKSLDLRGFQCLKMMWQGFYTLSPKNDVLLRNKYQKRTYIKQGADSLLLAVCALFFCLIQHHKSKAFQKTHKILVLTCGYVKFRKEKPTHDCFTLNTSVSSSVLDSHIQLRQIVITMPVLECGKYFTFIKSSL